MCDSSSVVCEPAQTPPTVSFIFQVPGIMHEQNFCTLMGNKLGLYIPHGKPGTCPSLTALKRSSCCCVTSDHIISNLLSDLRQWNTMVAKLDTSKVRELTLPRKCSPVTCASTHSSHKQSLSRISFIHRFANKDLSHIIQLEVKIAIVAKYTGMNDTYLRLVAHSVCSSLLCFV